MKHLLRKALPLFLCGAMASTALANGGPFKVQYPEGDPAAKGVLARIGTDLKPGTITDLKVLKEDLSIDFGDTEQLLFVNGKTPLARVTAAYTIENPTDKEITIDFGFPIIKGIYLSPRIRPTIISNSSIYGIIRQEARQLIEKSIAADATLAKLVEAVRNADDKAREAARDALSKHMVEQLKWKDRDTQLMLEYASISLDKTKDGHYVRVADRAPYWERDQELQKLIQANLGPLAAMGEQKATQFLAQLASCFDAKSAATYEAIFSAWGGDVRERSIDLKTGKLRPREIKVDPKDLKRDFHEDRHDPTIYARVDYFDEDAKISPAEKASCKNILKNLPVIFTFAPMNLIYYQAKFAPRSKTVLTVAYTQHAYIDSAEPKSYQFAYVIHPASMWKDFGPINLSVIAPEGVAVKASVDLEAGKTIEREVPGVRDSVKRKYVIYTGEVKEKKGELQIGIDAASSDKFTAERNEAVMKP